MFQRVHLPHQKGIIRTCFVVWRNCLVGWKWETGEEKEMILSETLVYCFCEIGQAFYSSIILIAVGMSYVL